MGLDKGSMSATACRISGPRGPPSAHGNADKNVSSHRHSSWSAAANCQSGPKRFATEFYEPPCLLVLQCYQSCPPTCWQVRDRASAGS